MNSIKRYILNKYYKLFMPIVLLSNIVLLINIRFKFNKIAYEYREIAEELNSIFLLILIFIIIVSVVIGFYAYLLRGKVVSFSEEMCKIIDEVIAKECDIEFKTNEETLLSKLHNKLKQLINVLDNNRLDAEKERDSIKNLIADISHQIKTPLANISMYNQTLIERDLDRENEKMFLTHMQWQINKLQWLVDAFIKMSRLQGNIIAVNCKEGYLKESIANAVSGIYIKAEDKGITIKVNCSDKIMLTYDKKWTTEALFNILDNAVKYNKIGGFIKVDVERFELFTKIDIKDSGIGIKESELNKVFKRFYRSAEVNEIEGVGIGLFLSNEIIVKQGGYIKVKSVKEKGTTFSVFLLN